MVPNHEMKGDYYANPCLPKSTTNINSKNGRKRSFSYETKESIHLSSVEWICGAQSWKKGKLLCVSIFIPIEKWNSILRKVERDVFLWNQGINIIYPKDENVIIVPNHENKRDYYVNPCLSQLKDELQF